MSSCVRSAAASQNCTANSPAVLAAAALLTRRRLPAERGVLRFGFLRGIVEPSFRSREPSPNPRGPASAPTLRHTVRGRTLRRCLAISRAWAELATRFRGKPGPRPLVATEHTPSRADVLRDPGTPFPEFRSPTWARALPSGRRDFGGIAVKCNPLRIPSQTRAAALRRLSR